MSKYGMFRPIWPGLMILAGIAVMGASKMREDALSSDLPTSEIMTDPISPLALIVGGLLIAGGVYFYVTLWLASKKAKTPPPPAARSGGPGSPVNRTPPNRK